MYSFSATVRVSFLNFLFAKFAYNLKQTYAYLSSFGQDRIQTHQYLVHNEYLPVIYHNEFCSHNNSQKAQHICAFQYSFYLLNMYAVVFPTYSQFSNFNETSLEVSKVKIARL